MSWRIYVSGTTTANGNVGGTTVVDTNRTESDDYFNNMKLKITSGAASGEERSVVDWVKSTGTFTVSPAFSTQILSGVTYEVGIYLPRNPKTASMKYTTIKKTIMQPGDLALLISHGRQPNVLSIEGLIAESGKTSSELETLYLKPIENFLHYEIEISAPDTRYDGTYVETGFNYQEGGGVVNSFRYKIEFYKGSSHVVL